MKRRVIGVIAAGILLAGTASAAERGFYVGTALGQSKYEWTIDQTFDLKFDPSQLAFKVFGGYQLNRYIGIEGGYMDLGRGRQNIEGIDLSVDTTAFQGSVILSYPVTPLFSPYVRGSAIAYDIDATASDGFTTLRASGSDNDFAYGVGAMFTSGRGTSQLRLDWEQTDIDGIDVRLISFSAVYLFY